MRIEKIFNSILEKTSPLKSSKDVSLLRKVAMWALCLIIITPVETLKYLPDELQKEILFFKEEIEGNNPFGGKIQLNPIPEIVKRMINKDSNVIKRLRADGYQLELDHRIWTFPRFE